MMDFITAPVIVGICILGIYKLFELFARRRERLAIIEKLSGELSPDNKLLLPDYSTRRFSFGALKAGFLLAGLGLGLLIGFFISMNLIPEYTQNFGSWEYRQLSSIVYGSCVLLFGGIGLLTAFVIELKMEKKKRD